MTEANADLPHIIAYLPSVEKVPSSVSAGDALKPTTEIAVTRYTAYKRSGCVVVKALTSNSEMFDAAEHPKTPYRPLSLAVVGITWRDGREA